jgi:hypothetical protein
MESLRQLTHGRKRVTGMTLDRKECLMLLRGKSLDFGRVGAELQELPQRVAKRGERLIISLRYGFLDGAAVG